MNQSELTSAARGIATSEFQAAIRNYFSAFNELERIQAEAELQRARGVLILEYGYTLEQLCQLADSA